MSSTPNQSKEKDMFLEFHEHYIQDSFNDFSDIGAGETGLTSLTFEDQVFEEFAFDTKFRCISSVQNTDSFHFNLATRSAPPVGKDAAHLSHNDPDATVFTRQDASKPSLSTPNIEVIPKTTSISKAKSSRPISAPPAPFYVSPSTHFVTQLNVGDIKARVEVELNSQTGVSYEFFPSKCRWEGVYLVGSARCKFEVNVYKQSTGGGFVVEGNRLSGDSLAFVNIYQAIRNIFVASPEVSPAPFLPIPGCVEDVTSSDVEKSIDSVLAMASSGIGEAQLGASQIFCDIFSRADATHLITKYTECLTALMKLMTVEFESCNQHAICALAHLSSSHSCQEVLMRDANFLHTLLPLCSDGNYNSIEMRRECARLLANISCCGGEAGAQQVVSCAGLECIESWMRSVDSLKDERLRVHADRAKFSFSQCISIS